MIQITAADILLIILGRDIKKEESLYVQGTTRRSSESRLFFDIEVIVVTFIRDERKARIFLVLIVESSH